MTQWYELRIAGSPGTTACSAGIKEGIAIGENGRLCPIQSGKAMKFATEQEAFDYLVRQTTPGRYRFEVVHCNTPAPSARPFAASANP